MQIQTIVSCQQVGTSATREPQSENHGLENPETWATCLDGSQGIVHVGLKVSDLSKSAGFYAKIMGLKAELRGRGVVRFRIGRDVLVLHAKDAGASDFHFGFGVDNPSKVDQWRGWLRNNKIPYTKT